MGQAVYSTTVIIRSHSFSLPLSLSICFSLHLCVCIIHIQFIHRSPRTFSAIHLKSLEGPHTYRAAHCELNCASNLYTMHNRLSLNIHYSSSFALPLDREMAAFLRFTSICSSNICVRCVCVCVSLRLLFVVVVYFAYNRSLFQTYMPIFIQKQLQQLQQHRRKKNTHNNIITTFLLTIYV